MHRVLFLREILQRRVQEMKWGLAMKTTKSNFLNFVYLVIENSTASPPIANLDAAPQKSSLNLNLSQRRFLQATGFCRTQ